MGKDTKKRAILYSNVKANKRKAEEITRIGNEQINLNDEVIIGLNQSKNNKKIKAKNRSKTSKKVKQSKKNSQNKQVRSKKKMNPIKKKKIMLIIKLFIILGFIVAGLAFLLKSSIFNISKIDVKIQNNKVLTDADIKNLSKIEIGQNIYSINKKEIITNIKNNSYVESVKVKRALPNTVEIKIDERSVKYQLKTDDGYIYIDEQGYILEKNNEKDDCMVITGYSTTDLLEGNKLNDEDVEKLKYVENILQEAEYSNILNNITSVDIKNKNDYKIYFDDLKKMAHLGDTSFLNEKMTYVKKILEVEHDYEGEIFVNVDLNNGEYPHFREKV